MIYNYVDRLKKGEIRKIKSAYVDQSPTSKIGGKRYNINLKDDELKDNDDLVKIVKILTD